ncbi:glucan endo-1,3-beta-glucosidase isoform X2 [Ziziphus jujuba]|nr:glucan endo-1,3-beta-glucosidase isoform X2 [Ziziphus jujuba]XP_048324863.2 glucan endo-1,3-beta-glucosidase isoform X2 [Ziziphus jujuba]
MVSLLLLLGLLISSLNISGAKTIGVCNGRNGNNLPSEADAVQFFKDNGIKRMRIYEPYQPTLQALRGSNIELTVGIPNKDLQGLNDPAAATDWVQKNVRDYFPDVKFRYIAVGNEVHLKGAETKYLLPAMENIQSAISAANLQDQIKVSTAIHTGLLENTFPPSNSLFTEAASSFMNPIVTFLVNNGSPLLANIYPYYSRIANPQGVSLEYALITYPGTMVRDTNLNYQNLFDAMVDAVYAALERAGGQNLWVVVAETGWPSKGGIDASVANAETYYKNLIDHVKNGTPKRSEAIETYLFAVFDENTKDGNEVERHFGVFTADKQPRYQLNFY